MTRAMAPDPHSERDRSVSFAALSAAELAEIAKELRRRIAIDRPKVHCLTNTVAEPISANALLALGAVPSLTTDPDELADFISGSDALMINIGTPTPERLAARRLAAGLAEQSGLPWVLDPTLADRSSVRWTEAERLLRDKPTVLRCNSDEMATLAPYVTGADILTVETGSTDRLRKGSRFASLTGGSPMIARVTATGCALSAVIAAFLAVHGEDPFMATLSALAVFGAAGAEAGSTAQGPGSLAVALLDHLSIIRAARIARHIEAIELTSQGGRAE